MNEQMERYMPISLNNSNIRLKTWLLIHKAYNSLVKTEEYSFNPLGISPQQNGILMAIKHSPCQITITDAANWLERKPNTISFLVEGMIKEGLIIKTKNKADHRQVNLALTDRGREVAEKANGIGWRLINEVLGNLPEGELLKLNKTLEKIYSQANNSLRRKNPTENMKTPE